LEDEVARRIMDMRTDRGKIRLAVIGAGAVAETHYLPALPLCSNILLTHLVDLALKGQQT
jgi:hypothetical protein